MVMYPVTEEIYLALIMQNEDLNNLPLFIQSIDGMIEVNVAENMPAMCHLSYEGKAYVGYKSYDTHFNDLDYVYSGPLFQRIDPPFNKAPGFVFDEFCKKPPLLQWHPTARARACLTFK